ncbi:hypothetical protein [Paenibacillus xylanexedens]|uniref:hypothetical protein n=1 Tax=Paenibacillus xylanexedens TaxID=528191 RepID=UPI001643EFB3|nr:hypothetical protein [Paenibacillus xylanexedens]
MNIKFKDEKLTDEVGIITHRLEVELTDSEQIAASAQLVLPQIPVGDSAKVTFLKRDAKGIVRNYPYFYTKGCFRAERRSASWFNSAGDRLTQDEFDSIPEPVREQKEEMQYKKYVLNSREQYSPELRYLTERLTLEEFNLLKATDIRNLTTYDGYTVFDAIVDGLDQANNPRRVAADFIVVSGETEEEIYRINIGFNLLLRACAAAKMPQPADLDMPDLDQWLLRTTHGNVRIWRTRDTEQRAYFSLDPGDVVNLYRNNWALMDELEGTGTVVRIHNQKSFRGPIDGIAFLCTVRTEDGQEQMRWIPYEGHTITG